MKSIRITFAAGLAGITLLWLAANLPLPETLSFMQIRKLLVQYSGVLGIAAMSAAMILITRLPVLDRWLDGLDKSYRLHKWLGITALVTALAHWIVIKGPHWVFSWGLLDRPQRQRGGGGGGMLDPGSVQAFLHEHHRMAAMIGEWAFYAVLLLIAVALLKRIPYRLFAASHTLIALTYLGLVFHSVMLMKFSNWMQPIGIVSGLLMVAGVAAALLSLSRQIGRRRRVRGQISALRQFPSMNVCEIEMQVDDAWPGHTAGQFAFVTFDDKEGKHPFTLASAWNRQAPALTFMVKALGDYTSTLAEVLSVGDDVMIEGPYGRFTFNDSKDHQIWIGAGIGITPFMARLRQLICHPDGKQIDLIHTIPEIAADAKAQLEADVTAAGANLHLIRDGLDGLLTGDRLRQMLPDWSNASVWFCGPAAFGQALRSHLIAHGLRPADFHQELFNMR